MFFPETKSSRTLPSSKRWPLLLYLLVNFVSIMESHGLLMFPALDMHNCSKVSLEGLYTMSFRTNSARSALECASNCLDSPHCSFSFYSSDLCLGVNVCQGYVTSAMAPDKLPSDAKPWREQSGSECLVFLLPGHGLVVNVDESTTPVNHPKTETITPHNFEVSRDLEEQTTTSFNIETTKDLCSEGEQSNNCPRPADHFCDSPWVKVIDSTESEASLKVKTDVYEYLGKKKASYIRTIGNTNTRIIFGSTGSRLLQENLYSMSRFTLEKAAWNRFHDQPRREIVMVRDDGNILTGFMDIDGKYDSTVTDRPGVQFFTEKSNRFQDSYAFDTALIPEVKEEIEKGYEEIKYEVMQIVNDSNLALNVKDDMLANSKGLFRDPLRWINIISIFGKSRVRFSNYVGESQNVDLIKELDIDTINVLFNPCWETDVNDADKLESYLSQGHRVRVNVENMYYNVNEIVKLGSEFIFILAPHLSNFGSKAPTKSTRGVRTIASSSGRVETCLHKLEGDHVVERSFQTQAPVRWFVDVRKWAKIFSITSDKTVVFGKQQDLVAAAERGEDIQVMVEWNNQDKVLYFTAYQIYVTENMDVSAESNFAWRLDQSDPSNVTMTRACDLEAKLVTSDGEMQVLNFNKQTPGTSHFEDDITITWFSSGFSTA